MARSISTSEVNSALQVFMDIVGYYFNIALPYKLINLRKTYNSKWITKSIKISSKRMHFLNSVKWKFNLSREAKAYIKIPYHIQKSTEGSQKRDHYRYIEKLKNVSVNKHTSWKILIIR
jgi:hypothetical protein